MSFSLRLTADLTLALASRAIDTKRRLSPVLHLSPETNFESTPDSFIPKSRQIGSERSPSISLGPRLRSPIIWIAGSEPLEHPGVARLANTLAASGRYVFLETSGAALKPRLHEFQPSSHFYFAVLFNGDSSSLGQQSSLRDSFRVGLEAIRMARLAGFFTCARLVLQSETTSRELVELHREICKLDVDGFLITPAARSPELAKETGRLRRRLLDRRWSLLSSLLDAGASPASSRASRDPARLTVPDSRPDNLGEGAEA
jgi:hypothetical protein